MLWNIFNTLQIIMALPLLLVNMPGNVTTIIKTLDTVVNFEIVPKEFIYDNVALPILNFHSSLNPTKESSSSQSSGGRKLNGDDSGD